MKLSLILSIIGLFFLSSCATAGYHPSYIISDETPEPEPVIEKEIR